MPSMDRKGTDVEAYLLDSIRKRPRRRFGQLIADAQAVHGASRATIAYHLSKLVRFGEVSLLADHTYEAGGSPGTGVVKPIREIRWESSTFIVNSDGSARWIFEEEFRVVLGTLAHQSYFFPEWPRTFSWWSSAPGRVVRVRPADLPSRELSWRYDFMPPLSARRADPQRTVIDAILPHWYDSTGGAKMPRTAGRLPTASVQQRESDEILSQAASFRNRVSADSRLRLAVSIPPEYPAKSFRFRVRVAGEPQLRDLAEEERLSVLSHKTDCQEGFRRYGWMATLSVPNPKLDRNYEITWRTPTRDD